MGLRKRSLTVSTVLFAAAIAVAGASHGAEIGRPTVDKLVATFDDVVFGAEIDETMRSKVVAKWNGDLRISVKGQAKESHIKYLRRHLDSILDITGLSISAVDGDEKPENVTVVFVPRVQMSKIKIDTVDPKLIRTLSGPGSCYFLAFRDPPDAIVRSIIVVNNERSSRAINHCLLEEVLQSLGLPNDSDLIRPSVFSDLDTVTSIQRTDEILVRTLYDPRLTPGMNRDEALVVARQVIAELDAQLEVR